MAKLVLIVEDSETCAETLQIALELIPGIEVRSIHSPGAAIAFLKSGDSDIAAIVTDLNLAEGSGLPGDGLELIRQLRSEPRFARLPILLISGDTDPRLSERALAQGADAFFPQTLFTIGCAEETGATPMLTKSLGLCLLALTMPRPAVSQTNPDVQRIIERLDKLEDENQKLLDEIRELRSELKARNPDQPAGSLSKSTAAAPTTDERLAVQESHTADLDQSKVGASQRFPISLTGMLLFNAFMNGRSSGSAQYPVTASLAPSAATDGATVRQTIVGLKFNGPDLPGGGKASGSIYMDFFGGSSAPGNNVFRIRTAALDLSWKNTTFTVGQDKPIISPREPSSLAQVGISPLTGAGNLWDWNPQVRVEQRFSFGENTGLKAQAGVYETTENYSGALPYEYAGTLEQSRPAYQGRFEFFHGDDHRRLEVAPGFSFSATHVAGQSIQSRIASIDWLVRPFPLLEFSGEAFNGQDVSGLGALPGFNIVPYDHLIPVHSHGEWGQIALYPLPRVTFHIYAGEQHNRASDIAPSAIQRNFVYAGNVMYKLGPNVLAALEAAQMRTEYLGSQLRLNNHYDLSLAYLF